MLRKYYADCQLGQIHWHAQTGESNELPPLVCLHPAPYSGAYFYSAMPLLNASRTVMAPDYPGYGCSSVPAAMPTITDYATAVAEGLKSGPTKGPVDVVGFHTGCLVGLELALNHSDLVRKLILVDVPYFDRATAESLLPKVAAPVALTQQLECLAPRWSFNLGGDRLDAMPYSRAFELFSQELLSGARSHWAFHAAFTYPCEARFGALSRHCNVIATQSGLLKPTRTSVKVLPNATLKEMPDVKRAVFEEGAAVISREIDRILKD